MNTAAVGRTAERENVANSQTLLHKVGSSLVPRSTGPPSRRRRYFASFAVRNARRWPKRVVRRTRSTRIYQPGLFPFRRKPSSHAHLRVHARYKRTHQCSTPSTRNLTNRRATTGSGSCIFFFFSKAALDKHAQNNRISKPGEERRIRCLSLSLSLFFSFLLSLLGF